MRAYVSLLAFALVAVGCPGYPTEPGTPPPLPAGLDVQFVVTPQQVSAYGSFMATLTVTNTTDAPIEVTTGHSCLVTPHVMRDGVRVPFVGTAIGCFAAITTHHFAPGEVVTVAWEMKAELYAEYPGEENGLAAPPANYTVRAEFETHAASEESPRVERPLVVR